MDEGTPSKRLTDQTSPAATVSLCYFGTHSLPRPLPDSTNRHIAREFEARLPLFWEASAKIPEYCIVAPRAVSSKFRHLVGKVSKS